MSSFKERLSQALVKKQLVSQEQLDRLLAEAEAGGKHLGRLLIEQ